MRFTSRSSPPLTVLLLVAFGLFMGLALAPTLVSYASADPQALWEAGGATALFIAGFGAAGYATRRTWRSSDASPSLPHRSDRVRHRAHLRPHSPRRPGLLGARLVIFAGLTMFDFQRLHRSQDIDSAPLIASSIFLDILNVFLFFLRIFSRND